MAEREILLPWTRQPQEAWPANPEAHGLQAVFNGASAYDPVTNVLFTATAAPPQVVGPPGLAYEYNGTSQFHSLVDGRAAPIELGLTLIAVVQGVSQADKRAFSVATNANNNSYFAIGSGTTGSGSKMRVVVVVNNVAGSTAHTTADVFDDTPHVVALRWTRGTGTDSWVDGIRDVSTTNSGTGSIAFNRVGVGALCRVAAGSFFTGKVFGGLAFNVPLADSDVARYSSALWEAYAPRSIWVPFSAGANNSYTVTADAAAYTQANQDATLIRARVVAADAEAYTAAAQDATLSKTRIVVADAGSYAVAGQDVALNVGYSLVAEAGAYALAGQDATLVRGRVVSAEAGAYALAGQDASLDYVPAGSTYTLSAEATSYALSGQAATLLRGRVLAAEAESYTLSGAAALFAYSGDVVVPPAGGGGGSARRRNLWSKEKPPEERKDPFLESLRAPYKEPEKLGFTAVAAPKTYIPFAKQAIPKELAQAIGDSLMSKRSGADLSVGKLQIELEDDDDIPDEVIMLALA